MQVKCTFALKHMNLTVGKEYETTYIENKTFLDYGIPYFELINDIGEPIGWAPCDMESTRFEKYPTVENAHGVESCIPVDRLHEVADWYRDRYLNEKGQHKVEML